jgi:predicted PurR-regulated permease PerM
MAEETRTPAPDVLRTTILIAAVTVGLLLLWRAHGIFITAILGVLFGLGLSRAADKLEERGVRRAIGAPAVLFGIIGTIVAIGFLMAPVISRQTEALTAALPKAIDSFEQRLNKGAAIINGTAPPSAAATPGKPQQQGQPVAAKKTEGQRQKEGGALRARLTQESGRMMQFIFPVLSSTFGAIAGVIIVIFIAMYIAVDPKTYRAGVVHLIPRSKRDKADELLDTLSHVLRSWLVARLMAMVLIGVVTALGLLALRVEAAIALGLIAGLLEFIPFFGPILSAIPALGIALAESPSKAVAVAILYLIIQQLEGNLITPLILEKRLDIPPVLTIVTVGALGVVFGVLGMLIAEPILAVALVTTKILYVRDQLHDPVKVGAESKE